jgi:hypothetical protein
VAETAVGGAVDAFGAEGHLLHHLREIIAPMVERRGKPLAEETIEQEQPCHDDERRPEHAPHEQE